MPNNGVESRDKVCLSCKTAIKSKKTLVKAGDNGGIKTICPVCRTEGQLVKIQRLLDNSESIRKLLDKHKVGEPRQ